MADSARTEDAINRALKIARHIAQGDDLRVREKIENYAPEPDYLDLQSLCVAKEAWDEIENAKISPRMVFAHPDILMAIPEASLHYRGLALLSRKRVQEIAGDVKTWELTPKSARVGSKLSSFKRAILLGRSS